MRQTKTKVGLLAAVVVAVVLVSAAPVAADGPFDADVTGGTLTTALGTFDPAPDDDGPCNVGSGNLTFSPESSIAAGGQRCGE